MKYLRVDATATARTEYDLGVIPLQGILANPDISGCRFSGGNVGRVFAATT
jgi:hypothetical protein